MRRRSFILTTVGVCAAIALMWLTFDRQRGPVVRVGATFPRGRVQPEITLGWGAAALVAPDGSLWAWGQPASNSELYLVSGFSETPHRVGTNSDWKEISAGTRSLLGIKRDGSLWDWRWCSQIVAATKRAEGPKRLGTESNWAQVSTSYGHDLALKRDGSLWAWGFNGTGELGDGTTNNAAAPIRVGADQDWKMIAAANRCSFALKTSGTLWGWGRLRWTNQLAPIEISPTNRWRSISVYRNFVAAINADGTLWCGDYDPDRDWAMTPNGKSGAMIPLSADTNWTDSVFACQNGLFARKKDGGWWVYGQNFMNRLGTGVPSPLVGALRRLPFDFEPWAMCAGLQTTVVLAQDGTLWTWGKRLGKPGPSDFRQKVDRWLTPFVRHVPTLATLQYSDVDLQPQMIWELPDEMRKSGRSTN